MECVCVQVRYLNGAELEAVLTAPSVPNGIIQRVLTPVGASSRRFSGKPRVKHLLATRCTWIDVRQSEERQHTQKVPLLPLMCPHRMMRLMVRVIAGTCNYPVLVVDWKSPNVLSMESQVYDLSMTVYMPPAPALGPACVAVHLTGSFEMTRRRRH